MFYCTAHENSVNSILHFPLGFTTILLADIDTNAAHKVWKIEQLCIFPKQCSYTLPRPSLASRLVRTRPPTFTAADSFSVNRGRWSHLSGIARGEPCFVTSCCLPQAAGEKSGDKNAWRRFGAASGLLEDVWSMYMTSEPPSFLPSCVPSIIFPSYTLLLWMYHRTDFVEVKSFLRFGISDVLLIGFLCRQLLEIMCWECSLPKIALISQTNGGCLLGEGAKLPFGSPPRGLWKPSRSKVWPVRSEISSPDWPLFFFLSFYTLFLHVLIPFPFRHRSELHSGPFFSLRELSSSGFFCLPFKFLPHDCISPGPSMRRHTSSHALTMYDKYTVVFSMCG